GKRSEPIGKTWSGLGVTGRGRSLKAVYSKNASHIDTPTLKRDVEKLWSKDESGGSRVFYFTKIEHGEIWLLVIYTKGKTDTLIYSRQLKRLSRMTKGK
ncbi:hypothetical protein OAE55_07390, partial [Gammaproteobacteria bacterium]|nr:hypothetical protein [Gammaproteobacteria bacterium]